MYGFVSVGIRFSFVLYRFVGKSVVCCPIKTTTLCLLEIYHGIGNLLRFGFLDCEVLKKSILSEFMYFLVLQVLQKLKEFGVNGVEELTLIADPQNEALNRGYAFLELATHYDAVNAFQRLHRPGVMFGYDRPAKVSWAQPLNEADASMMSQV